MTRRFLLVLLLLVVAPAAAQTFPQLTGRVVDQANIIPDDREVALTQQLEQLQRATSRQLVVATVSSLEGYEIQDYAYRLGRQWGIGQAGANNGVVLLVAPNERHVWITVGPGLQGFLTDAFTGRVVREQIIPRFRENDYPGGIEAGVNALVEQMAAPPEQAEQRALEAERARQRQSGGGGNSGDGIILLVVFGFIFLIFIGAVSSAGGGRRRRVSPWGRAYGGRSDNSDIGWFIAGAVLDGVLRGASRGGGSSWGGGSDWGGGSSWGGGGGFSGGGGSFDGGGAGGSW